MVFRVELAPRAYSDLDSVAGYIKRRGSFESAQKWFNGIMDEMATLREMPYRCPVVEESRHFGREVRMLLYGRRKRLYKAFYIVDEVSRCVTIVHVRHWARESLAEGELDAMINQPPRLD